LGQQVKPNPKQKRQLIVALSARARLFHPISRSPGKNPNPKFDVAVARAGRSDDWFLK
jgi:hypothetical protein